MEKYTLDYDRYADFRGLSIDFNYLEEGLNYAEKHNIKHVLVRAENNDTRRVVNFDFLKSLDFIETFHWIVRLSKKSDITGLYHMLKLKELRWGVDYDFILDLSHFPLLQGLNIGEFAKFYGWEALKQLEWLQICSLKTDDLSFLKEVTSLEDLRIIGGAFTSITGIEKCEKLKLLTLQRCRKLTTLKPMIQNLPNLTGLTLEACRKVDTKDQLEGFPEEYVYIS